MNKITFFIPAPAKFINANDRLHYAPKAKLTAAWREAGRTAATGHKPMNPPVHITAHIQKQRGGRWDPNNLAPTTKAIVDGIVDAGILEDDSWKEVLGPDHRRGEKGQPGIWITIKETQ